MNAPPSDLIEARFWPKCVGQFLLPTINIAKKSSYDAGRSCSFRMLLEGGLIRLLYLIFLGCSKGALSAFTEPCQMREKLKSREQVIPGNLSCSVLELELLSIRLWFKYIMIKILKWLNSNLWFVYVLYVCAICDDRQPICDNLERFKHFFQYLHIYSHSDTEDFSVWNHYVQSKLHRRKTSVLFPFHYVLGSHMLISSLHLLVFLERR